MRLSLLIVILVTCYIRLSAENITWIGGYSSNWFDAQNWSAQKTPSNGDAVTIKDASTIISINKDIQLASLSLTSTKLTLLDGTDIIITERIQADSLSTISGANSTIQINTAKSTVTITTECPLPALNIFGTNNAIVSGKSLTVTGESVFSTTVLLRVNTHFKGGIKASNIISELQFNHKIEKSLAISKSEMFNATISGTENITIAKSKINSLKCINNSKIELSGNLSVNNSCSFLYGVKEVDLNYYQLHSSNGGLFIADSTVLLRTARHLPAGFSQYSYNPYSSTELYGSLKQELDPHIVYGNLILSNSDTVFTTGSLSIKGSFKQYSGVFDCNWASKMEIGKHFEVDSQATFIHPPDTLILLGKVSTTENLIIHPNAKYSINNLKISTRSTVYQRSDSLQIMGDLIIDKGTFSANSNNIFIGGNLITNKGRFTKSGHYHLVSARDSIVVKASNKSKFMKLTVDAPQCIIRLADSLQVQQDFLLQAGRLFSQGNFLQFCTTDNKSLIIKGALCLQNNSKMEIGNGTDLYVGNSGKLQIEGTAQKPIVMYCNEPDKYYSVTIDGKISAKHYIFEHLSPKGITISQTAEIDNNANLSYGIFRNYADSGNLITINVNQTFRNGNAIKYINFEADAHKGNTVKRASSSIGTIEFYYARGRTAGNIFTDAPAMNVIWTGSNQIIWKADAQSSDWQNKENWISTSGTEQIPNDTCIVYLQKSPSTPPVLDSNSDCLGMVADKGSVLKIQNNPVLSVYDSVLWNGKLDIGKKQSFELKCLSDLLIGTNAMLSNKGGFLIEFESRKDSCLLNFTAKEMLFTLQHISFKGKASYTIQQLKTIDGDYVSESAVFFKHAQPIEAHGNWHNTGPISQLDTVSLIWSPTKDASIFDKSKHLHNITIGGNAELTTADSCIINGNMKLTNGKSFNHQHFISLKGDFINTKTDFSSSAKFAFVGNTKQVFENSDTSAIAQLELNNTELQLLSDLKVSDSLILRKGKITSNANGLILPADCKIQYNDKAWAECKVFSYASRKFIFPLGGNSLYAPLAVEPTKATGTGVFSAQFIATEPTDTVNRSATLFNFCTSGHWDLNREEGTAEPLVGILINSPQWDSFNAVAHYNDSIWEDMGGTSGNDGFLWSATPFTTFSPVSASQSTKALPAELTKIWLDSSNSLKLRWVTASEHNLSHFAIQLAEDDKHFYDKAIVPAKGNKSGPTNYVFTIDQQVFESNRYIRLKAIDFNGEFEHSQTLALPQVKLTNEAIWPVPIQKGRQLHICHPGIRLIAIFDSSGKTVDIHTFSGYNNYESIPLNLKEGIYYMRVAGKSASTGHQFTVYE